MLEKRRKTTLFPDLFFSKFFLIVCVIVFFAVLVYLAKSTVRIYKVDSEANDLQNEIERLDKQNKDFSQLISYLKSDAFIEQEAKLKMGLKKPGENLVVIHDKGANLVPEDSNQIQNQSNPRKWWFYFFNK